MFHHLSHSVGSFIKSLKSALGAPQKQDEAPQNSVRKHDKKRRRQRHPSDTAYIRKADSRQASSAAAPSAEKQQPRAKQDKSQGQQKPQPQARQPKQVQPKQPKNQQKSQPKEQPQPQAKQPRQIPPMPSFVPPPEEPGKMRFCDLELSQEVLAAVQVLGFLYCTEIQKLCMPYALAGRDLAAKAQTGTGKTAAFLSSLKIGRAHV